MTPTPEELLAEAVRLMERLTEYFPYRYFGEGCVHCSREPRYDHMSDCPMEEGREFVRQHKERKP